MRRLYGIVVAMLVVLLCGVRPAYGEGLVAGDVAAEQLNVAKDVGDGEPYLPDEIPDDFVVPRSRGRLMRTRGMPSAYDARADGLITPVRNQDPYNLCWAFSVCASGEASLVRRGQADLSLNLSEMHLGRAFEGPAPDSLGLCTGDSTEFLRDGYLLVGNNNKFTTFALANWVGLADESAYPYDPTRYEGPWTSADATDAVARLRNAYWIAAADRSSIKQAVMDYGCVGLSYYRRDSNFNQRTSAYYNATYTTTNHAVSVVGWDDNFPARDFLTEPAGDGAWLVKNSLGSNYGDGGYFWLSYYDASISSALATAFVFDFEDASAYDFNYHYDGSYGTHVLPVNRGGRVAAVYKACGSSEQHDELLAAVSLAVGAPNVSYDIRVFTDLKDESDPQSGTVVAEAQTSGTLSFTGVHTIELAEPVRLVAGQTFSIVVALDGGAAEVPVFVDESYQNGNWIQFTSQVTAGQTFVQRSDGTWQDLNERGVTARVKGFTIELDETTPQGLRFEDRELTLYVGEQGAQEVHVEPERAEAGSISWQSSDETVATVDAHGIVRAHGVGEAVIRATENLHGLQASYIARVQTWEGSLALSRTELTISEGQTYDLILSVKPEEDLAQTLWSSSDEQVAQVVGGHVMALAPGKATITASARGQKAACEITVLPAESEDEQEPIDPPTDEGHEADDTSEAEQELPQPSPDVEQEPAGQDDSAGEQSADEPTDGSSERKPRSAHGNHHRALQAAPLLPATDDVSVILARLVSGCSLLGTLALLLGWLIRRVSGAARCY